MKRIGTTGLALSRSGRITCRRPRIRMKQPYEASENQKPYWLFRRAYVLHELGRFEEAIDSYIAAANLTPLDQIFGDSVESHTTAVRDRLLGLVRQLASSIKSKLDAQSFFDVGMDAEKLGTGRVQQSFITRLCFVAMTTNLLGTTGLAMRSRNQARPRKPATPSGRVGYSRDRME